MPNNSRVALSILLSYTLAPRTESEARSYLRTLGLAEEAWDLALDLELLRPAASRGRWTSRILAAELLS